MSAADLATKLSEACDFQNDAMMHRRRASVAVDLLLDHIHAGTAMEHDTVCLFVDVIEERLQTLEKSEETIFQALSEGRACAAQIAQAAPQPKRKAVQA